MEGSVRPNVDGDDDDDDRGERGGGAVAGEDGGESSACAGGDGENETDSNDETTASEQARKNARVRIDERYDAMVNDVTLTHENPIHKFRAERMYEGVEAWDGRTHSYTEVPEEMINGVFLKGTYNKVPPGELTLKTTLRGDVYAWREGDQASAEEVGFPGGKKETIRIMIAKAKNDGITLPPFPNWECIGTMNFTPKDSERKVPMVVFKYTFPKEPQPVKITIGSDWHGGVGFMMAPDDEATPESSEKVDSDGVPLTAFEQFLEWLAAWDPVETLDEGLHMLREKTLLPLEQEVTSMFDAETRTTIMDELTLLAEENRLRHIEQHPEEREQHHPDELLPDQVIEIYRRLRPRHRTDFLFRALAGKAAPKDTIVGLGWRFLVGLGLILLVYFLIAAWALSPNDVVVHEISGGLVDPSHVDTPIAASAAVHLKPLWEYPSLAKSELRTLEDVVFVHRRSTYVIRVAGLEKKLNGTLFITGSDGSLLRIEATGSAYWRQDGPGTEEQFLSSMEAWRSVQRTDDVRWMSSGLLSAQVVKP